MIFWGAPFVHLIVVVSLGGGTYYAHLIRFRLSECSTNRFGWHEFASNNCQFFYMNTITVTYLYSHPPTHTVTTQIKLGCNWEIATNPSKLVNSSFLIYNFIHLFIYCSFVTLFWIWSFASRAGLFICLFNFLGSIFIFIFIFLLSFCHLLFVSFQLV